MKMMMTILSTTTTHRSESVFRRLSVAHQTRTFDLLSNGIFITVVTRF